MILPLKAMVNMVINMMLADGAEAHDVVESHNEVATQGATTTTTTTTIDGAHNEHEHMEMLIHLIARLLVMM
jgi:hypothetical protein